MPRVGLDTGFPVSNPLAPLHADPVARAIGPGANRNRPRWVQLGWPQILRLLNHDSVAAHLTRRRCATCRPKATGHLAARRPRACPVVSPHRSRLRVAPRPSSAPAGLRLPRHPRVAQARSDPTPAPVSRDVRRLVVAPVLPKESDSPVRGGREHCPCSDSALASWSGVGWAEAPLLTAPVGVRSPERASVNTAHNPWSRGIFEFTGLSPKLSRYPQDFFGRPPVAHRSCTTMCTVSSDVSGPVDCIRRSERVQWGAMTNQPVAAIIIIP